MTYIDRKNSDHILIIDDDLALCEGMSEYLTHQGYSVDFCTEPEDALVKITGTTFDGIILDLILPRINGLRLFKYIREQVDTPILMLTAKDSDLDEVIGLELGSEDYIKKPCNMRVLTTRLNKMITQNKKVSNQKIVTVIKVANIIVNLKKRNITVNDSVLKLTNSEYKILEFLARNKGKSCSKESIIEYALGRERYVNDSSLDVHISHLRKKLKKANDVKASINTDYGYGYILDEDT